jgi:signal peptidase I
MGPRRSSRWLLEWALVLIIALGVAVTVRAYVVQTFFIPSASMEPTLMVGDRILVDKLSYDLHPVHTGDIVVFAKPPDEIAPGINDLVKRVIGLPNQTIASGPGGTILINGHKLAEPWLTKSALTDPGPPITTQKIPPGHYFVMGDNRGDSEDSRVFGTISGSLIVGRVTVRIWPLSALHIF